MSKFKIVGLSGTENTNAGTPQTNNGGGIGAWCSKHWFLTFLLASSVIGLPVTIINATKSKQ